MAAVNLFGSGTIAIGTTASPTDQFECQVSNFTLTSTSQTVSVPATFCDGATTKATPSSWAVSLTFAQDWGATPSLSELLYDEDGELIHFSFVPSDATAGTWAGTCYAVAGDVGGEGQALWVSTDDMPCPAKPTYTAAV